AIRNLSADVREELLLNALRDRSALAVADLYAVDAANRRHLGGGAAEEHFVSDIEHLARDQPFDNVVPEIARDLDDARARDAGEDRGSERRGENAAGADDKPVPARPFPSAPR